MDPLARARATRELALCLGAVESSEQAASLLSRAAGSFAEAGAAEERAETLLDLGLEQIRIARSGEAERTLTSALELFAELDRPAGMSRAHLLLGDLFQDTGSLEKALTHFKSALEIAEKADLPDRRSRSLQRIGSFYTLIGYTDEALDYLTQALTLQRRLGLDEDRIDTLAAIGWAHFLDLDARDSLPYYDEALELAQAADDQSSLAGLLDRLGSAYRKLGRLDESESAYRRSLEYSRRLQRPAWQAHTLSNLGRLMLLRGDPAAAGPLLDESLRLMESAGDLNGALPVRVDQARVQRGLGHPREALSQLEDALASVEKLREGLTGEDSRMQFVDTRYEIYEELVDLLFESWETTGDRHYLDRALETTEQARARGLFEGLGTASLLEATRGSEAADRLRRLVAARDKADASYEDLVRRRAPPERIDAVERDLRRLRLEIDEERSRLLRELEPEIARRHLTSKSMSELAARGVTILVYSLGTKRSFAFVLHGGRVDGFVLAGRGQIEGEVESAIRTIERSISSPQRQREVPGRLASLARETLAPAAGLLDADTLVVVPDGALAYLPFDVLPRPDPRSGDVDAEGEPILARSKVVMLPSISVLALQRRLLSARAPAPRSLVIFADPAYTTQKADGSLHGDGSALAEEPRIDVLARVGRDLRIDRLTDLPNSAAEAHQIARYAGGSDPPLLQLGFDASRANFLSLELDRFRNIHFAGHGLFDSVHPELSGLVFSLWNPDGSRQQGLVHPRELHDLALNAELITLSACRTAWGREVKGEGLLGITRALLYAGARRVLVSSWSVDDRATAELMDRFYYAYLRMGATPAEALRSAKLSMRNDPRWSLPVYWGAFSLHGDWR